MNSPVVLRLVEFVSQVNKKPEAFLAEDNLSAAFTEYRLAMQYKSPPPHLASSAANRFVKTLMLAGDNKVRWKLAAINSCGE